MTKQADTMELQKQIDALDEAISTGRMLQREQVEQVVRNITVEQNKGLHGMACYYAAYCEMSHGRAEEALGYLNESIGCLIGTDQEEHIVRCYNMLGILAHGQDNLILAMEHYHKALAYEDRFRNPTVHSMVVSNMADAYYRVGIYEKANQCYAECIQEYETYGDHDLLDEVNYAKMLASYGYCLVMSDQMEEASRQAAKLEELSQRLGEQTPKLAIYGFYAYLYHKQGRVEQSIDCMHQAMDDIVGKTSMDYDNLLNLIHFIVLTERYDELQEVLDRTEPLAASEHNEGLLIQLLVYRLKYCCDNMPVEDYMRYTQTFFQLKDNYLRTENSQILKSVALRNLLKQIEEQQETLKKKNTELQYQMEHDIVSGLHNRGYLNRKLEECFEYALRQSVALGIVFIDIDYFKEMNDSYGHQRGDECIRAVADVMKDCMKDDYVARYGGDEFVVITLGDSQEELEAKVQKISDGVRRLGIPNEKSHCAEVLTVTIGVVQAVPRKPNRVWDYLATADEVLYRQKKEQKGKVRFSYRLGEY